MIAMLQETGKSLFDLCLGVVHYSVVHLGSWGALLLLGLLPLHINLLIVFVKRISITKSRLARWSLLPVFALSLLLSFLVFAAAWAYRAWGPIELRPDLDESDTEAVARRAAKNADEIALSPAAKDTLEHIQKTGRPPHGYKGDRRFKNDGRRGSQVLPRQDKMGNSITHKEYDVAPHTTGVNRGTERPVVGSDERVYTLPTTTTRSYEWSDDDASRLSI